jgi:hypothetical protein
MLAKWFRIFLSPSWKMLGQPLFKNHHDCHPAGYCSGNAREVLDSAVTSVLIMSELTWFSSVHPGEDLNSASFIPR